MDITRVLAVAYDGPTYTEFETALRSRKELVAVGSEGTRIQLRVTGIWSVESSRLPIGLAHPENAWVIGGRTVAGNEKSDVPVVVLVSFGPDELFAGGVIFRQIGVLEEFNLDFSSICVDELRSAAGICFTGFRDNQSTSE